MLKKEGLLVTANARIAPIATTVSPVPVLIGRFYPLQRYSCHSCRRKTHPERVRRVHADGVREQRQLTPSRGGTAFKSHTCAGHSTFAEVVNRYPGLQFGVQFPSRRVHLRTHIRSDLQRERSWTPAMKSLRSGPLIRGSK